MARGHLHFCLKAWFRLFFLLSCLLWSDALVHAQEEEQVLNWGRHWIGQGNRFDLTLAPNELFTASATAIAAGDGHSLALLSDGTIVGWGDFTFQQAAVPFDLPPSVAVTAGSWHSVALHENGTVAAWGDNTYKQLEVPEDATNIVQVRGGIWHTLALRKDGTIFKWGTDFLNTPFPENATNIVAIAAAQAHGLGLKPDGTLVGWGGGTLNPQVRIPAGLSNVISVSTGWGHTLALKHDGSVVAWGGSEEHGEGIVPEGLSNVVAVAAGSLHSVVMLQDGSVVAWGAGKSLNRPTLDFEQSLVPENATNVAAIAAGAYQSMALKAIGPPHLAPMVPSRVGLYGGNVFFTPEVTGSRPLAFKWFFEEAPLPHGTNWFLQITNLTLEAAGRYRLVVSNEFGISQSEELRLNVSPVFISKEPERRVTTPGQTVSFTVEATGVGPFTYQWQKDGTNVPSATESSLTITNIQTEHAGMYSVLVSNEAGTTSSRRVPLALTGLIAWGNPRVGQTNIPPGLDDVISMSVGESHCIALKREGTVVGWGLDGFGQTIAPPDLTNAIAISAGNYHNIALRSDGTLTVWGYDGQGQTNIPPGLSNVVAVAAGGFHNLALTKEGIVYGWGMNNSNQVVVPPGLSAVVAIAAGRNSSAALKADGTVVFWGANSNPPTPTFPGPLPTRPIPLTNIVAMDFQTDAWVGLRANGIVVGRDGHPVGPTNLPKIISIATGAGHTLALNREGLLSAWYGNGDDDPFGPRGRFDNQQGQGKVPVGVKNITEIAAGGNFSMALIGKGTPLITTPLLDTQVIGGSNLFLRASAIGEMPIEYQWQLDGVDIPHATNSILTRTNFSTAGVFTFVAQNNLGSVTSGPIRIEPIALTITKHPVSVSTYKGATPQLSIQATGPQPMNYEWYHNAQKLPTAASASLKLTNVQLAQSGEYYAVVRNSLGSVTSITATVSVGLVAVWGYGEDGKTNIPPNLTNIVEVVTSGQKILVRDRAGNLAGWPHISFGETNAPENLEHVVQMTTGPGVVLALRDDGTLIGWGSGDTSLLELTGIVPEAKMVQARGHALAVSAEGYVYAVGSNFDGQTDVPQSLKGVVAVAAGSSHSLALREDGTVVGWGGSIAGEINSPPGLSNVVAIAAGYGFSAALKNDGTVFAWGDFQLGQLNGAASLRDIVQIAAGDFHGVAIDKLGRVQGWGANVMGQLNFPNLENVQQVAAGWQHSIALMGDGPPDLRAEWTGASWKEDQFSLTIPTLRGSVYSLERTDSLTSSVWNVVRLVLGDGKELLVIDETANAPLQFYRVRKW